MRGDLVTRRRHQAHAERAGFGRITIKDGDLGPLRKRRRRSPHLMLPGLMCTASDAAEAATGSATRPRRIAVDINDWERCFAVCMVNSFAGARLELTASARAAAPEPAHENVNARLNHAALQIASAKGHGPGLRIAPKRRVGRHDGLARHVPRSR